MKPHLLPSRRCGALAQPDGSVCWRVWAPKARRVDLLLDDQPPHCLPMEPEERGFLRVVQGGVAEGRRYAYRLDNGPARPDPCALWQPDGVHGPSAVVRPGQFHWTDAGWKGVPRKELVIYELHVGTFTPDGTFDAMIPRLAGLRELGVTALEVMPVAQFPGTRDWGYDGVGLYAVQNSYGGPGGLQRLVDACHGAGLAVLLDVVYNHLGPEGNYLREFGPYFTDRYKTPWGEAINYDGPGCDAVRDFVLDNARMWLEEFHLDGLRLDAVQAMFDMGARHIVRVIKETADEVSGRAGRNVHIIAESDLNDPRLLLSAERGGYGLEAQWADDFHHAVHAYLTGERWSYYEDFGKPRQLVEALRQPFVFAGSYSRHRKRKYGAPPPPELTGERFVVCLQNHDQVGNRAQGERLATLLESPAQQRLAVSLLLLSPYVPLLFMGQEYGEEHPFGFFCSFGDTDLVRAVREGRKKEFPEFVHQGPIPDPQAESTFAAARLTWSWPEGSAAAGLRRLYADLLAARRAWPALADFTNRDAQLLPDSDVGPLLHLVRGGRTAGAGHTVEAWFNLSGQPQRLPAGTDVTFGQLLFTSESNRYLGERSDYDGSADLRPYECIAFGPLSCRPLVS
jgi:maltooligosyltrehalose trehalohydrolase